MTATPTRRSNEPTQDPPARHAGWSHDWQSKWSHEPGRKPATPVPCSWQATGANLGTCLANTNTIDAGGKWKFKALCSGDAKEVATVRFKEITGF